MCQISGVHKRCIFFQLLTPDYVHFVFCGPNRLSDAFWRVSWPRSHVDLSEAILRNYTRFYGVISCGMTRYLVNTTRFFGKNSQRQHERLPTGHGGPPAGGVRCPLAWAGAGANHNILWFRCVTHTTYCGARDTIGLNPPHTNERNPPNEKISNFT